MRLPLQGERMPSREVGAALKAATPGETSWFLRRLLMRGLSFSRALRVTGHFANGECFSHRESKASWESLKLLNLVFFRLHLLLLFF